MKDVEFCKDESMDQDEDAILDNLKLKFQNEKKQENCIHAIAINHFVFYDSFDSI